MKPSELCIVGRRLVRKALFQEPTESGDKVTSVAFALDIADVLTTDERSRWNTLSKAHQEVVEALLENCGDTRKAHARYRNGKVTSQYFAVACKRAGAILQGGTYSHHNVDADGIPYTSRNAGRRPR